MKLPGNRTKAAIAIILALSGCATEQTPPAAPAPAPVGLTEPTTEIPDSELLTGRFKNYQRSFALAFDADGKRQIQLFGNEDKSKPRQTNAQLVTLGRELCRTCGLPSNDVSVSDLVMESSKRILTFLKCD